MKNEWNEINNQKGKGAYITVMSKKYEKVVAQRRRLISRARMSQSLSAFASFWFAKKSTPKNPRTPFFANAFPTFSPSKRD